MSNPIIGPITLTYPQLVDDDSWSISSNSTSAIAYNTSIFSRGQYNQSEELSLLVTRKEALQIKGLIEIEEPVWIDPAPDLTDNDYLTHRGWYLITDIDFSFENQLYYQAKLSVTRITTHENEYLEMDYSMGIFDGLKLDYSYAPTTQTSKFSDTFTTFDDTNSWYAAKYYQYNSGTPSTHTVTSDGSDLVIANKASANNKGSVVWTESRTKWTPPFTAEVTMKYTALPAVNYFPYLWIGWASTIMGTTQASAYYKTNVDINLAQLALTKTTAKLAVLYKTSGASSWTTAKAYYSVGTTDKTIKFKYEFDGAYVSIYTDVGVTGTYTRIYYGKHGIKNYANGIYLLLGSTNYAATVFNMYIEDVSIYNMDADEPQYLVHLPTGCTPVTTATGTRTGATGSTSYYTNPTDELFFTVTNTDDLYDGSVQLYSANNEDSTSRQIFNTDAILDPLDTILMNDFTKLVFKSNGFEIYGYTSGTWTLINTITTGTINLLKPRLITHDEIVLQVNRTKIHITRSPMFSIYHPDTALSYTLQTSYYHDGTSLSTPSAGDDLTMEDSGVGYYAWAGDATNRLVIGKKDPCTIKVDSIPADEITGLGWNTSTMETAADVNCSKNLVFQWWKQTRTGVSWKAII